jgi:hypothetical protein
LLSFVPDVLFIEGNKAYLVNPLSSDISVYSYGQSHPIIEGRYLSGVWDINRVQVEGADPVTGALRPAPYALLLAALFVGFYRSMHKAWPWG